MPCVDNKDLIYNIKELQETFSITSGDLLVVETEEGTNIMDYDNLIIGLDNTTFGTTITNNTADISALSATVDTLSNASQAVLAAAGDLGTTEESGFAADTVLLSENGYQVLPTGLIMQWGVSERTAARQEDEIITFPLAFPTACLNITGMPDRTTFLGGNLCVYLKEFTATTATFVYDSDNVTWADTAIRWQAFGY